MNRDREIEGKVEPNVPTEHPDRDAASRPSKNGVDRPGADLGGASREGRQGPHTTIPGGPVSDPDLGKGGS